MAFNSCRALNVIHQTTSYMTERNSSDRDAGVGANNSNSQVQRQQEPGYRDKRRSSSVVENWDLHPSEEQQNSRPEPPLSKESWVRAQVLVFSHLRDINSFHPATPSEIHFTLPNPQYKVFHSHFPSILFDLTFGMPGSRFLSHFTDSCLLCQISLPFLHLYELPGLRVHPCPFTTIHFFPKLISFS